MGTVASPPIDRPNIEFDDERHAYVLDGEPVPGVSSIAKIGADNFSPGAWWGWRIAIEGIAAGAGDTWHEVPRDPDVIADWLKEDGCTPNARRDKAGDRGTAVHDALERLAQDRKVPRLSDFPRDWRGHVKALLRWFTHYQPEFEATEVMVGSRKHRYAGRYDIRARIDGLGLVMVDLKTSKSVYPETHFPQLEGYELASVEMGFPATDGRWVLRTSEDGSFVPHDARPPWKWAETNFVRSWATPETFLGYLAAYKGREADQANDPEAVWLRKVESWLMCCFAEGDAWLSRDLAQTPAAARWGLDSRAIGRLLGGMRKRGLVKQEGRKWMMHV